VTRTLLVAGTASHVGKSTVAAGLCRHLADAGVDVAPFKAQNMANNARAVPTPSGEFVPRVGEAPGESDPAFGEVGISQYVQARAARVEPSTDHNPVLLKPRGGGESQLVLDGQAVGHYAAGDYYDECWDRARETAALAHERLAAEHDVVVAEGAGSVAEINLHHRDLANLETARFADADVLLVGDIERGGVFGALVGSLELLPEDVRERVVGAVITKFRGDPALLDPGPELFAERTGVPVVGVVPYDDPGLPAEDSLSLPDADERATWGQADAAADPTTVAVPHLPRLSNVADLDPLAATPGVRVSVRPLDAAFGDADAVVLPGTKNTVDDLLAAREVSLGERLRAFDGPVVGLCGGYQLLGRRLTGAAVEGVDDRETVPGLDLLPVETAFSPAKRVRRSTLQLSGVGPLAGADGRVSGFEIHAGRTRAVGEVATPLSDPTGDRSGAALGAASDRAVGTYLHGLFENDGPREAFLRAAGWEPAAVPDRPSPYDAAADLVAEHLDLAALDLPA
jgi:adenosylcobyric acid synthase